MRGTLLAAAGLLLVLLPSLLPSRPGSGAFAVGGEGRRGEAPNLRCWCPATRSSRLRRSAGEAPTDFQDRKEALKRCLAREYRSFFRPFEADYYTEDVTFKDPLNELKGKDSYRRNVEMLSGDSLVGNILFRDGWIDLHSVEDVPGDERRLRTRWTLGFTFKLLPWQPQALFSGVSEYVIDGDAKVVSQRDYWDTLSLGDGGSYAPEDGAAGAVELGAQLLPFLQSAEEPEAASAGDWALLRRAEAYRVYRSKQDDVTFAIGAPGAPSDRASLETALRAHGLVPGAALRVLPTGRGRLQREEGDGSEDLDTVPGVELLQPHPWDGPAPPG